ncbi:hypothetical protein DPX16_12191 [Anabarilius grahami]|uniref:Peptidase aspartic putative domain-containing protein n=1 Tax=Anabarilius grahami TaxID=495550 RepID=A0A3N0YQU3_ANAGA|nr:hypothetical protein DPX16_12191 [Anabarilius grahami]
MKPLTTVVNLTAADISLTVVALLDSGSAGNFVSGALCRQLRLKTSPSPTIYQINSITGRPLSRKSVRTVAGPIKLQVGPDVDPAEPPLPLILEDGAAYEVHEILDSRCRGGQLEYLVDAPGFLETTSSIPTYSKLSTTVTLIDRHRGEEDDHHGVGVLGPQERAVEGGYCHRHVRFQHPPITAHTCISSPHSSVAP